MNTRTKNILLIVLGVAVIGMTVAFAALSTQLQISGTTSVPNTSWNIHFQNWADNTNANVTYGGNTHANTASYPLAVNLTKTLTPNITKVEGLNVTLKQPGDYVSYTFQIINEGTIDASLDNFDKNLTCASGNDCSHLSYTIECVDSNNNNVLTGNPTLAANGGLAYCTLTVTYTDQTNSNAGTAGSNQVYTQSAASATLDATWVYVQKVDSQANSGSGGSGGIQTPSDYTYYAYGTFSEDPSYYYFNYEYYQEPTNNNQCQSGYAYYEGDDEYNEGCYFVDDASCDNGDYNFDNGKCEFDEYGQLQDVSDRDVYIRDDGELKETCLAYPSGFVCLTNSTTGYYSDFEGVNDDYETITSTADLASIGLKGYTESKVVEMLNNGASSCTVYDCNYVICDRPSDGYCDISSSGGVSCTEDSNLLCSITSDGSSICGY